MTKKKQSKRSAKQSAKKTSSRTGVAPTLHEIPAAVPPPGVTEAQVLSAPEPIVADPPPPDLAAGSTSPTSIAAAVTNEIAAAEVAVESPAQTPSSEDSTSLPKATSTPELPPAPFQSNQAAPAVLPTGKDGAPEGYKYGLPEPETQQDSVSASTTSITNDIPTPPAIAEATATSQEPSQPPQAQKTAYDMEAIKTAASIETAEAPAAPNPPTFSTSSPALNPQSLGSLTRSKSSSDVSRALPGKEEPAPKWRPPVDYFGASASAFSSSFAGSSTRDPDTIKSPGDSSKTPQTPQTTDAAGTVYEPGTDTAALSPKMAQFVSNLRERELTASGASSPVLPKLEATSVEITPISSAPAPTAPPKITPVTSKAEAKPPEPKAAPAAPFPASAQTARDLAPMAKIQNKDGIRPEPKAFGEAEALPLAPKSSSQVAELRESIISQRVDGKPEDWHPVPQKKPPRQLEPHIVSDHEPGKPKLEGDRHLSLEEMAALDPDLVLAHPSQQQQSIRRLKSKTSGGIRAEIYIPIYIICLGLSWVTEKSAAAGTCRDAGQRIESALQLVAPKSLADNFVIGTNIYDDREIKLHPFNPSKPRNPVQIILSRILAFCSGISSAFGRIPAAIAASSTSNPIAEVMIVLSYASILILSLLIFLRFKRSTTWSVADFILLPIGLVAASTIITAILIAVLSLSASLAVGYVPNTIVLFTSIAVVLAVLDMARRSFFGRKQAIVRD